MKKLNRFPNGLTLLYEEMPAVRSISLGVFVRVGSVYEDAKNNGISHFIEHIMFKGTEKRTAFDIVAETDNLGAQINAFTSKTTTCYYIQCVDRDIDKCTEILSDIFFNSVFPEDETEKEKGVVLEEIAMCRDTPDDLVCEAATAAFYKGHPLARPILGSKKNVAAFTRTAVEEYIDKHYTADNTLISIAGNLSYEQAVELINKYFISEFSRLKCRNRKISTADTKTAYVKNIKKIEQGNLAFVFPSVSYKDSLANAARIFNSIFGYGMSSRLYQQIRERMGLAYSVYSYPSMYPDNGYSLIYIGTNTANIEKATLAVRDEILKVKKHGISKEEFLRGKAQIKSSLVFSGESSAGIMTSLGRHAIQTGGLYDIDKIISDIDAVTMDDINLIIDLSFNIEKATASYVGPKFEKNLLDLLQGG